MARHVLIIGKTANQRRILQARILSILDDVVISEANGIEQAGYVLENNTVHLVIYGWESADSKGIDFCKGELSKDSETEIPYLLLVNSPQEHIDALVVLGVTEYVLMPCSDRELSAAINRVCDPLGLRRSKRYSIAGACGVIEQRNIRIDTNIINFSSGGVLCEFEVGSEFNCADPAMISISFVGEEQAADNLYSVVTSLKVINRNSDFSPCLVRVGFKFITVPKAAAKVFECIMAQAEENEI